MLKALRETFNFMLHSKSSLIEPYSFVAKLGTSISRERRRPFNVNGFQDPMDVLQHIFEQMIASTYVCTYSLTSRMITTISCVNCNSYSELECPFLILPIMLSECVQTSIMNFIKDKFMSDFSCNICKKKTEALRERRFTSLPEVLVV